MQNTIEIENKVEDLFVYEILKQIRQGTYDPKLLSIGQRQECVAILRIEGHTYEKIAAILKLSIKTAMHDFDKVSARHAAMSNYDQKFHYAVRMYGLVIMCLYPRMEVKSGYVLGLVEEFLNRPELVKYRTENSNN